MRRVFHVPTQSVGTRLQGCALCSHAQRGNEVRLWAEASRAVETSDSLLLVFHHEQGEDEEDEDRESDERYEPENQGNPR